MLQKVTFWVKIFAYMARWIINTAFNNPPKVDTHVTLAEDLVCYAHGNRVANKLGRRGYVTVEMRKNNLHADFSDCRLRRGRSVVYFTRGYCAFWKALMTRSW